MIQVCHRGETVGLWSYIQDWEGVDTSPDNGVKITLTNPKGIVKVDAQAMTEKASGKFVYYYTTPADDETGWWHFFCKSQDGTGDDAKYTKKFGSFKLL